VWLSFNYSTYICELSLEFLTDFPILLRGDIGVAYMTKSAIGSLGCQNSTLTLGVGVQNTWMGALAPLDCRYSRGVHPTDTCVDVICDAEMMSAGAVSQVKGEHE
jgi:hypothetical protein